MDVEKDYLDLKWSESLGAVGFDLLLELTNDPALSPVLMGHFILQLSLARSLGESCVDQEI